MKEISIAASPRSQLGKGPSRQHRMAGHIPAVVYGPEIEPMSITLDARMFRAAMKASTGAGTIFNLDVDGRKNKVLIREIQRDPVTSTVMHVDFHAISMNKPIHVSVPIHFVGLASGVKNQGGIMQATLRDLEIACLPRDIPERVEVDVTALNIGDSIHVRNISIPNVTILSEAGSAVVVISAPTVLKSAAEEAAATAAEAEAAAEGAEAAETAEGAEVKEGAAEGKKEKETAKEKEPKKEKEAKKGKE